MALLGCVILAVHGQQLSQQTFPLFFISPKLEKCYRFFDIFFDSSPQQKKITIVSRIYTIIVEIQNY